MDGAELRAELEKHHHQAYAWALSCCSRDPVAAEETLQKAYLKILDGSARFGGKASLKTWLFALIRNTAADEFRHRSRDRAKLIEYEQRAEPLIPIERPDEKMERSQVRDSLAQALAGLPARQQEILRLVFYHDLSLSEAAAVMGISLGTARTHYERGKDRLRRWLETGKVFNEYGLGRK